MCSLCLKMHYNAFVGHAPWGAADGLATGSHNESRDKSLNAQRNGAYTDRNYADESEQ